MLTVIKPVNTVKLAIAGVGNCASSLVQGIAHYRKGRVEVLPGLMHPYIGGWGPGDLEVVAAFDVDRRKVGRPLEEAIFAKPNCTMVFEDELPSSGVVVQMGPILDGVAPHMADYPDDEAFRPADADPVDIADVFKRTGAEVLVCYLPVGSEQAALHYAQACLDTGVAMVNCIPVFIASNPSWAEKFKIAGVPIVGDDIKSQVGATIAHRLLTRLFGDRGYTLDRTYQLNTGGNTDFLNMKALDRLTSKKCPRRNPFNRNSMCASAGAISISARQTTCPGKATTKSPLSAWKDAVRQRSHRAGDAPLGPGFAPTAPASSSTPSAAPGSAWSGVWRVRWKRRLPIT